MHIVSNALTCGVYSCKGFNLTYLKSLDYKNLVKSLIQSSPDERKRKFVTNYI